MESANNVSRRISLSEWLDRLENFSPHEIELGLDRVQAVLDRLQLDEPACLVLVAGTNGKGSSVELARALMAKAGERVGTYTSPHVLRFNERICIDGKATGDAEIVAAFERVEAAREDTPLSYFEYATLAAACVFAAQSVHTVILEVGMGGRLDAVNAFEPDAGLITNVSLDHCDWLGDNVEAIAAEKAGIMRRGKPVVYGSHDVPEAILRKAEATGANPLLAGRDFDWSIAGERWAWRGVSHALEGLGVPSLTGEVQIGNAAGVLALAESLGLTELLKTEAVNQAFTSVSLDGRMQRIKRQREWLFDVAHNAAAAQVLGKELARNSIGGDTVAVVAVLDDKDVNGIIEPLAEQIDRWIAVSAQSPRAIPVEELARQIANITNKACMEAGSLDDALSFARQLSGNNDRVLITGSFYLVGPALRTLGYTRAA